MFCGFADTMSYSKPEQMADQQFYVGAEQGGVAALACRVQGSPPPSLSWFRVHSNLLQPVTSPGPAPGPAPSRGQNLLSVEVKIGLAGDNGTVARPPASLTPASDPGHRLQVSFGSSSQLGACFDCSVPGPRAARVSRRVQPACPGESDARVRGLLQPVPRGGPLQPVHQRLLLLARLHGVHQVPPPQPTSHPQRPVVTVSRYSRYSILP